MSVLFYNVFWATGYKTTSLPAALNQARRIDTLVAFYYIRYVDWSCIFWRPSLCIILLQAQRQIMNKDTQIIAGFCFFVWYFSGEEFATNSFYGHCS
jgi:hypothetical protein